jgi:hypothetical protein
MYSAYKDTTIVLAEPDPGLANTVTNHYLACADKITTPDGGKTWIIPNIKVSPSTALKDYQGSHAPGPVLCK